MTLTLTILAEKCTVRALRETLKKRFGIPEDAAIYEHGGDEMNDLDRLVSSFRLEPDGQPVHSPWLEDDHSSGWVLSIKTEALGVPMETADFVPLVATEHVCMPNQLL